MTRAEHLAWSKRRALEYLDDGDALRAFASLFSDLMKHPDLARVAVAMMGVGITYAIDRDIAGMRRFIEGFQ